jgi:hypothetical protein
MLPSALRPLFKESRGFRAHFFSGGLRVANNVLDWAIPLDIPPVYKCVLLILADDADKVGKSRYLGTLRRFAGLCRLSRRHLQRILRTLETWGLIRIYAQQRESGTDTVHLFQCELGVDPETWECPKSKSRRTSIMSTSPFDKAKFFNNLLAYLLKSGNQSLYETWLSPLQILKVEKDRIVFRLPGEAFVAPFHEHKWLLLEVAQGLNPSLKRIHVVPLPAKK